MYFFSEEVREELELLLLLYILLLYIYIYVNIKEIVTHCI